jgi:hypothetical protein
MNDEKTVGQAILGRLTQAVDVWVCQGIEQPLTRWLERELDPDGVPTRLTIQQWHECLHLLSLARGRREEWPSIWDEPVTRLIQTTLRFSRPDGSAATDFARLDGANPPDASSTDRRRAQTRTRTARAADGWLAQRKGEHPPGGPLAAWSSTDRVLAVLRAEGLPTADFLAIDHRNARSDCRFELFGAGRSWLGPSWRADGEAEKTTRPRPQAWSSTAAAGLIEWSSRAGAVRLTRSIVLVRARRLALLAVLAEESAALSQAVEVRVGLPVAVAAVPDRSTRTVLLTEPKKSGSAQILPIGLPCTAYLTDRGSFQVDGDELVLNQAAVGRRSWLPLLVSWDSARHRKDVQWRILTVSERSRIVGPDRAFAARVSWGRHETYVIYRSLGPPATRAFLGHHTRARFLIGLFTPDGTVEPILEVD